VETRMSYDEDEPHAVRHGRRLRIVTSVESDRLDSACSREASVGRDLVRIDCMQNVIAGSSDSTCT